MKLTPTQVEFLRQAADGKLAMSNDGITSCSVFCVGATSAPTFRITTALKLKKLGLVEMIQPESPWWRKDIVLTDLGKRLLGEWLVKTNEVIE